MPNGSLTSREFSSQLRELLERAPGTCSMSKVHWDILEQEFGPEIYVEALYRLTRLDKPTDEARSIMQGIVAHQQKLCATLGRGVNLLTAASDHLSQSMPHILRAPILIDSDMLLDKEESAYRDELTGLFNRRYFNQEIPREIERFRRFGQPFTLLMLDLDHFKDFNDSYGHLAGDKALRDSAQLLVDSARLYDRAVRYGGEEFTVILPQTGAEEAVAVAERIRQAFAMHNVHFAGKNLGAITISVGLACYPNDGLDMDTLVQNADQALYIAKNNRNKVQMFTDSKRHHPRYILSDPLPLAIHTPVSGKVSASAWDISLGGLMCSTDTPLPRSSLLHLVLSDTQRSIFLPLVAEVRRVSSGEGNNFNLGLSFKLESVEDQKKLLALLDGRVDLTSQPRIPDRKHVWA